MRMGIVELSGWLRLHGSWMSRTCESGEEVDQVGPLGVGRQSGPELPIFSRFSKMILSLVWQTLQKITQMF